MESDFKADEIRWPQRTWLLAGLGALFGLIIQQLGDLPDKDWGWGLRIVAAAMIFLGVSGLSFALSWIRGALRPVLLNALLCGVVAGGVLLWNGVPGDDWGFWSWQLLCGLVAAGFFLTLFQAAQGRHPHLPERWTPAGLRHWKRRALVYADVHDAIWTDGFLIAAAVIFTGIAFLVAELLASMFMLVDLDFLRRFLRHDWVIAMLWGGAFGGAIGLLRERAGVIAALHRVAMMILRVLAPVLAVGIVAFLAVLPFTGLAPLWATRNATPIMLSAALMALFLVNAVTAGHSEDAAQARVLQWSGRALGLALLPMTAIAAWSTGLRIGQHGLSPERLWALTFIFLACGTAIAYAVAILWRGDWMARLHRSNLHLAFILGAVSLLLSTSLISFERIATANQLARLAHGTVSAETFDYKALWFRFGPSGRAAIRRLARDSKERQVRDFALAVQKLDYSYEEAPNEIARRSGEALDRRLTIVPKTVPLDPKLRERLVRFGACGSETGQCLLYYRPGDDYAIAVRLSVEGCKNCMPTISALYRNTDGSWGPEVFKRSVATLADRRQETRSRVAAIRAGKVEMRTVERRQLFIDGKPFDKSIPLENASEP